MPVLRIEVDDELKEQMDRHSAIDWSQVAQQAIRERISQLEEWDELTEESQLTEEEADELAGLINQRATERALQEYRENK